MALSYTTRRHGPYLDIEFSGAIPRAASRDLKELGFVWKANIRSWRSTRNHDKGIEIAERTVKRAHENHYNNRMSTLCCDCDHAGHGDRAACSWVREFKPVDGWDADEVHRKDWVHVGKGKSELQDITSYRVKSCPLYKPDPPRKRLLTLRGQGFERLVTVLEESEG